MPDRPTTSTATRCGYVTLLGRPNAGKSTLLNRLVGQHLSIVTPKAQTTWQRVTGILSEDGTQLVFLDTPGLLEARDLLQRAMLAAALEALHEADVVLAVQDAGVPPDEDELSAWEATLSDAPPVPVHVALNKVDRAPPSLVEAWGERIAERALGRVHVVSALDGTGVRPLLDALRADAPLGPFLYPEDDVASDPVRFFVAELVRETIFEQYRQEIPYAVFCQVQEFREGQDPIYIHVDVFVERASQKGILIGNKGAAIRELGRRSREKVEHFLGARVYLDLWVKPLRAWRKNRAYLSQLGFRIPEDDEPRTS